MMGLYQGGADGGGVRTGGGPAGRDEAVPRLVRRGIRRPNLSCELPSPKTEDGSDRLVQAGANHVSSRKKVLCGPSGGPPIPGTIKVVSTVASLPVVRAPARVTPSGAGGPPRPDVGGLCPSDHTTLR